jgi:hypothetical protein
LPGWLFLADPFYRACGTDAMPAAALPAARAAESGERPGRDINSIIDAPSRQAIPAIRKGVIQATG